MRQLSSTLLAAQKQGATVPYVKIEAISKIAGINRYDWLRLYDGSEDDYYHALTMPGDGSLVRVRITLPADSRKLYRQRVTNPGPGSDYSQWAYTEQYNAVVVAAAALGAEVSVFWIKTNREIRRIKSTDYGANWGSPELIDYTPTTAIYGLAAAYKPNGDLAIFFADQATLYVKKNISGEWQTKVAWDKTTGNLSGVGCEYDGDWNLLLTGKDTAGNYKLWSLVYGDGGDISAGTWSALQEITSAPVNGEYEYLQPFLDKTDVHRCFFIEKYTGSEASSRPYRSNAIPGGAYSEGLWREPAPFNLASGYGLAMAHYGNYGWLSSPDGVWRAPLAVENIDLTADIISLRQELDRTAGSIDVEIRNDDGRYASPGEGSLAALDIGCQLEFSPGYVTASGAEYSGGQTFYIETYEHNSAGGKASLILHVEDGWGALNDWKARQQFRWNKSSDETSVKNIIGAILARAGLKLDVKTQSAAITGFYPDFTINAGDNGGEVIRKLLSFVPDVLFIEGNKAYLVNPQASDSSIYAYGTEHPIHEGRYKLGAMATNRVQVEGWDTGAGDLIIADSFDWDEIDRLNDRLRHISDRNLNTVAEAQQRGQAVLRQAEIGASGGVIRIPVNCGQQLYDVVTVTDAQAGIEAVKKRILGITTVYRPQRGEYFQRLELGGV